MKKSNPNIKLKKKEHEEHKVEINKKLKLNEYSQQHKAQKQTIDVMASKHDKLSEGAQEIFNIQKTRNSWGNKQLWGSHEKGRNKPGHKTPKTKKD